MKINRALTHVTHVYPVLWILERYGMLFFFNFFLFSVICTYRSTSNCSVVCTEMILLSLISAKSHFPDSAKIPIIDGKIEKKTSLVR